MGTDREGIRLGKDGFKEALLATLSSAALAAVILYMRSRGYPYWLAGIGAFYTASMALALRIHALTWKDGRFTGVPLAGRPVEFGGGDIAAVAYDDRSRPPRARLELRDGRRLTVKVPRWLGRPPASRFEEAVRRGPVPS